MPLLHPAARSPRWPTVALVEHEHVDKQTAGPDFDGGVAGGDPTTYQAIRLVDAHVRGFAHPLDAVYVEYQDAAHELEFYDVAKDPFERNNIAGALTAAQRAALHRILHRAPCVPRPGSLFEGGPAPVAPTAMPALTSRTSTPEAEQADAGSRPGGAPDRRAECV